MILPFVVRVRSANGRFPPLPTSAGVAWKPRRKRLARRRRREVSARIPTNAVRFIVCVPHACDVGKRRPCPVEIAFFRRWAFFFNVVHAGGHGTQSRPGLRVLSDHDNNIRWTTVIRGGENALPQRSPPAWLFASRRSYRFSTNVIFSRIRQRCTTCAHVFPVARQTSVRNKTVTAIRFGHTDSNAKTFSRISVTAIYAL